jgi:hypothetical protein
MLVSLSLLLIVIHLIKIPDNGKKSIYKEALKRRQDMKKATQM